MRDGTSLVDIKTKDLMLFVELLAVCSENHSERKKNTLVTVNQGTAVAQWLRCCATNRKVAGSMPGGVIGIFH